jgi:mRNA-degrading endonuclease RelE of RelBE toxin-antitoxin system
VFRGRDSEAIAEGWADLASGRLAGLRSARRIIYRIIYRVEDEDHRIDIIRIDHGRVYR